MCFYVESYTLHHGLGLILGRGIEEGVDKRLCLLYCAHLHLTFEQHGYELPGSTYSRYFSIVNTTEPHILWLVESVDAEGPRIPSAD